MSLIKVNELLQHATEHHYGVPAINVINTETIRYAIQAAEDEHMPIIIQYWPGFEDHCALDIIAFAARYYAERASVPSPSTRITPLVTRSPSRASRPVSPPSWSTAPRFPMRRTSSSRRTSSRSPRSSTG